MLLAIDIGNSFAKFGFFENALLIERLSVPTSQIQIVEEINSLIKSHKLESIIVSSVVPNVNQIVREYAEQFQNFTPIFVNNAFNFNLKIKYDSPENLGVDRIIAAFAAGEKYGQPCIVCDFGTATTIDAVNSIGEYLGGTITPGLKTLAESLFLKTAQLPNIEIVKPEKVIGNSTVKSIQSGVYFGYVGLVDGIIERIISELDEKAKVVATGGFARFIAEESKKIELVDDDLMLEGLSLIYENRLR